jgi:hypothetical protein
MVHIYQHNTQQVTATELQLDALWSALDDLHTHVVEGELDHPDEADVLNWLREMRYMMQETIEELEGRMAQAEPQPTMRLVQKAEGANRQPTKHVAAVVYIVRRDDTG